jgi:hypothetical protein
MPRKRCDNVDIIVAAMMVEFTIVHCEELLGRAVFMKLSANRLQDSSLPLSVSSWTSSDGSDGCPGGLFPVHADTADCP